jgi:hypothetical protein
MHSISLSQTSKSLLIAALSIALTMRALPARASNTDPRVRKVVGQGLDWLAYQQHKLGHWTAQGRYPAAMTAPTISVGHRPRVLSARPPAKAPAIPIHTP